jgi:hypothetical protein
MTASLDVLNHVLSVVGETPVSNPDSQHPTAQTATNTINRVNKRMQLRGWWFNRDLNLILSPNLAGEIILPSTTIKVDPVDSRSRLVWRGNRLYDPINHTFVIGTTVPVNIVTLLNIDDLPDAAVQYLSDKSAYDFYVNDDGDELKAKLLLMEVQSSWAALTSQQMQMSNVNAKNRPTAARVLQGIGQYGSGSNGNPDLIGGGFTHG